MDNPSKILAANEKLIDKARSLSSKRTWLPRALHNLFRNNGKVDQLFSDVLANQNALLAQVQRPADSSRPVQTITPGWQEEKTKLESENRELRAQLAAATQRIEQASPHTIHHFFHIPKTAGTSVAAYLSEAFGPSSVLQAFLIHQILNLDRVTLRSRKFITGHFFGLLDPFLGMKTRKITFLRDPFERAVSNILQGQRYENSPLSDVLRQYSVEEALTHPSFAWLHHNYQTRYIASLAFSPYSLLHHPPEGNAHPHHLMERMLYECVSGNRLDEVARMMMAEFDFVGLTEHLNLSLKGVAEAWNLPYPQRDYTENQNPKKVSYSSMVSESVRREFYRQNELDYELWNSVRKRLLLRDSPPSITAPVGSRIQGTSVPEPAHA